MLNVQVRQTLGTWVGQGYHLTTGRPDDRTAPQIPRRPTPNGANTALLPGERRGQGRRILRADAPGPGAQSDRGDQGRMPRGGRVAADGGPPAGGLVDGFPGAPGGGDPAGGLTPGMPGRPPDLVGHLGQEGGDDFWGDRRQVIMEPGGADQGMGGHPRIVADHRSLGGQGSEDVGQGCLVVSEVGRHDQEGFLGPGGGGESGQLRDVMGFAEVHRWQLPIPDAQLFPGQGSGVVFPIVRIGEQGVQQTGPELVPLAARDMGPQAGSSGGLGHGPALVSGVVDEEGGNLGCQGIPGAWKRSLVGRATGRGEGRLGCREGLFQPVFQGLSRDLGAAMEKIRAGGSQRRPSHPPGQAVFDDPARPRMKHGVISITYRRVQALLLLQGKRVHLGRSIPMTHAPLLLPGGAPSCPPVAVTFIGDVHGWADRLERVLVQAEGRIVLMGDLIDRGPQTPQVLDRVHGLCLDGKAQCLMGNHEWMLRRVLPPEGGVDGDAWAAWVATWGGHAVLAAYGVDQPDELRRALGPHLPWLSNLPRVLAGGEGQQRWIAVHAGLDPSRAMTEQLRELTADLGEVPPAALFSKQWLMVWPGDVPADTCLVSGHTPREECFISSRRILCDSSGGMIGRQLSGVIWPQGQLIVG